MALISTTITRLTATHYRVAWSGTGPFYIYYRGQRVLTTTATEYIVNALGGEYPAVEVADDVATLPQQLEHPGRIRLTWYRPAAGTASYYRVRRWTGSAWATLGTVFPSTGGYHEYEGPWCSDLAVEQYQVLAYDSAGNAGTAVAFAMLVVRHPDIKALVATYDPDTGNASVA
jgi:hypothetical protein